MAAEKQNQENSNQSWGEQIIEKIAGNNEALKSILKLLLSVAGFLLGLGTGYLLFGRNKEKEIDDLKFQISEMKYEFKKCERESKELLEKLQQHKERNQQLEATLQQSQQKEKLLQNPKPTSIPFRQEYNYLD